MGMPGKIGQIQFELIRERLGNIQPALAEAGESAGGPAELQNENAPAQFLKASSMTGHRVQPACGFGSESRRNSLLQPGSSWHYCRAMGGRKLNEGVAQTIQIGSDRIETIAQLQNEAGINRVLAGCAPVHVAHGFLVMLPDEFRQLSDNRDGEVARLDRSLRERLWVEEIGAALTGNRSGCGFRNDVELRFRSGQSGFKIEHALQTHIVCKDRVDCFRTEQWIEQVHEFRI